MCQYFSFNILVSDERIFVGDGVHHERIEAEYDELHGNNYAQGEWATDDHSGLSVRYHDQQVANSLLAKLRTTYPTRSAFLLALRKAGRLDQRHKVIQRNGKVWHYWRRQEWYENGQRRCETWRNGKLHGRRQGWYANGQRRWDQHYRNGELHGRRQGWYENGKRRCDQHYRNGELHGRRQVWHANGKRSCDEHYRNGERLTE